MHSVATFISDLPGDAAEATMSRSIHQQSTTLAAAMERVGVRVEWARTSEVPSTTVDGAARVVVVEQSPAYPYPDPVAAELNAAVPIWADAGHSVIVRHHDLSSQLHGAPLDVAAFPEHPRVHHVAINLRSRRELQAHGVANVSTIPYGFDFTPRPGDREGLRRSLGVADDTIVVLQPTRVSERKNVAGSIRYLQQLTRILPPERLHFWITGPVPQSHQAVFERLLAHCPVPSTVQPVDAVTDAYAACDVVLYPSTWDRFGTPIFEAIAASRPCVVGSFPVLGEIEACGIKGFSLDEPDELVKFLAKPSPRYHEANLRRANTSFGLDALDAHVRTLLFEIGVVL